MWEMILRLLYNCDWALSAFERNAQLDLRRWRKRRQEESLGPKEEILHSSDSDEQCLWSKKKDLRREEYQTGFTPAIVGLLI